MARSMLLAAGFLMLAGLPVVAQDGAKTAADCMRRAMTTGLERLPPSSPGMTEAARSRLGAVMDRNAAKKAEQARKCITETQAEHLGRLSFFFDVFGPACGMAEAPVLRSPEHRTWGDTDLINGAAIGYAGSKADGAFFSAQNAAREDHRSVPEKNPGALCQVFWAQFGSRGDTWPGLIVRTKPDRQELPIGDSSAPLSGKSTGQDYVNANTMQRVRWVLQVARLSGATDVPSRAALAAHIDRCLEVALTGKGSEVTRTQELSFMSAFCSIGAKPR